MFKWHRVEARAGFEVVVNGRIVEGTPLHVGREDQVYFVSFAPCLVELPSVSAPCREGIAHQVETTIRAQFQRGSLSDILRGAGYSTYRKPIALTVEEFAKREGLWAESRAAIQTFVQGAGFFDLNDKDALKREINQRIADRAAKLGIAAEVVSCGIVPQVPDPALLASLAARGTTDAGVAAIVNYFREVIRHQESLGAEREQAKVQAQQRIINARTDLKVFEIQEAERIAEGEQTAKEKAEQRQMADQERNARLKAHNAELEFAYKDKRLDEDKDLAAKEMEVARARMAGEEARRQARREDMRLDIEREEAFSRIRGDELAKALERLKEIPAANYSGLQTLVTGAGVQASDPSGLASGLVLGLLGNLTKSGTRQAAGDQLAHGREGRSP